MNDKEFKILSIYHELKQVPWHELRDKHTVSAEFMDWADNKNDVQMVVGVINNKLESYNIIERIPRTIALDQTSKITALGDTLYVQEAHKRNLLPANVADINAVTRASNDTNSVHPIVFLSYSHDDESHKSWVLNLANLLLTNGIDVLLDVYELNAGKNITHFIETAIKTSGRIIVIFTPNYKLKADNRKGGVGYEYSSININVYKNIANNEKVIPLLRSGNISDSIPDFFQQYLYVDFCDDKNFEGSFQDLIREIYKEPKHKKAALGQKPNFDEIKANDLRVVGAFEKNRNIYVKFSDNTENQLTFSNLDSNPLILSTENSVLFIRDTFGDYHHPSAKKIMKVNYDNLFESTVTRKKPYTDGLLSSENINEVTNLTLSLDHKHIYFLTEAYATSGNLVKVDLQNGNWEVISDAMDFELIKIGAYKNLIAIGKSQIKDRGRDVYYYLINEKNETLKEFISKDNYIEFQRGILTNN